MSGRSVATRTGVLTTADGSGVTLWRDYDRSANALAAGMSLGTAGMARESGVSADGLYARGARQVTFDQVIDLSAGDAASTVRALSLIRDLTACGIVVRWRIRAEPGLTDWRELSHLYPPARLISQPAGAAEQQRADWARYYYLGKCMFRRGPGLLQVRDRRWGGLRRITLTRPDHLEAAVRLQDGAPADSVPPEILAEFAGARLTGMVGDVAWWLPYRIRRWPSTSMVI